MPHGQRFAKIRKFDAQVFVNNSLQQRVMRGPANFTSWVDSWLVFRTAMISLQEASPQVLDDYQRGIRNLVQIHPDVWDLIFAADEIMRGEVWDEMKDELMTEGKLPKDQPWNTIIRMSTFGSGDAKRGHWWYLHVQAPAQRGGKDLVKAIEGTTLLPSPDGLFGPVGTATVTSGASSSTGASPAGAGRGRARANKKVRSYRGPYAGGAQEHTGRTANEWTAGGNGKGKSWQPKGKGKGDRKGQAAKGKKGGKTYTK